MASDTDVSQLDQALRLHQAGRLDEAEAICRNRLAGDPSHPQANYVLGLVLQSRGQLPGAAECYRRALEVKPELTQALCNLGIIWRGRGRFPEALRGLQQAAGAWPGS